MTTGEKRSVTSSMKKSSELFLETTANNLSSFASKELFINEFFSFWVNYSLENRLSWCYDKKDGNKNYHLQKEFRIEMEEKIKLLFEMQLSKISTSSSMVNSLHEVSKRMTPIRSKKKRLRKKWEKKQKKEA